MEVMPSISDPRRAQVFSFVGRNFDPLSGVATLIYRIDDGPELVERLVFPYTPWPSDSSRQLAFEQALELLHLVAGVSYWKAGIAPVMEFPAGRPGPGVTSFLTQLYSQGLAEFAYVNQVDVTARLAFFADEDRQPQACDLLLPERALVAMGGGKDSLVALNLLRESGIEVLPACVGGSSLIGETVKKAGLPLLQIRRELAPGLKEMNTAGAWNGHVPVTAINSAILVCAALLYGYRYVIFANERSADEATLFTKDEVAVNHQYSKSSAFEKAWQHLVHEQVSPNLDYCSVLRPFSELEIVRRFARLKEFHPVYSSCNRNFHLDGPAIKGRWCGDCPKCRFAALSLALFLDPGEVEKIIGSDLLADPAQEVGFRELCALGREKPFECVGEMGESRAAMAELANRPGWQEKFLVKKFAPELAKLSVPSLESLLLPSSKHSIPADLLSKLTGITS
jgi:hypothetical protein